MVKEVEEGAELTDDLVLLLVTLELLSRSAAHVPKAGKASEAEEDAPTKGRWKGLRHTRP